MTYGHIRGTPGLRSNIAALYGTPDSPSPVKPENVLVTPGAISANYLCLYTLAGPDDHVIVHYPTYQQLYAVPESVGASVSLWKTHPENNWLPDLAAFEAMLQPNTKLIVLNNPQNPTGAILESGLLEKVVALAKERGILLMVDEVYRPLFHDSNATVPSGLNLGYEHVLVTGSLSKAYALAGLRVGWVASLDDKIIQQLAAARGWLSCQSELKDCVESIANGFSRLYHHLGVTTWYAGCRVCASSRKCREAVTPQP
jgi:aspartate/methionine/tyrosine aminotransferase